MTIEYNTPFKNLCKALGKNFVAYVIDMSF